MIRLTLKTSSEIKVYTFDKPLVLLGSDPVMVDLPILGSEIEPIHLKIADKNGTFFLSNETNDPFVSLNDLPFGKKALKSNDIISIHHATILFEKVEGPKKEVIEELKEEPSPFIGIQSPSFNLPFEQEIESLKGEEIKKEKLDQYLKELETLPQELAKSHEAQLKRAQKKKKTVSLKDDYLRDLEDDPHRSNIPKKTELHSQAWKWVFLFIISVFIITGIAGGIIYYSINDKTEVQETIAAQGVSDIAMALMNAKLTDLKPHNQNYSDADFLKTNLQAILPDTPSYASQINPQGQFMSCTYTLRIYTNSDLSHFLLIAQPAPNLLYWLIPQSMIVVDSNVMELRKLKDVKSLNRLLANPDPLEGPNSKEITNLVKKGTLISLSSMGIADFTPPKNLSWDLPGTENLIYNVPRYYRLGQNIVNQALNLATAKGSSQEVAALKRDIEKFSSLNHAILYTDQGKKSAALIQQAVELFAPSDNLLFGYLLFNAQGKIHQAHLIHEDDPIASVEKESEPIPHPLHEEHQNPLIDHNHPIYIQLKGRVIARENELKPLINALNTLANQELANPRAQFQVEYQNLCHTYLMTDEKHKKALKENLESLYSQYENIPIQQFLAYAQELHLDQLIQQEGEHLHIVDENCLQNMEALLTHIEKSKTLPELNNIVHIASSWLNFDYIKDPKELIRYQNLVRNCLLEQLEGCLLTQKANLTVKEDDREVLKDILNQERLIKKDEKEFFLEEFEDLVLNPHQLQL